MDALNQQAAGAVARPDDRTVPATFQGIRIGGERQPAFPLVLAVTFEAPLHDDGADLQLEVARGAALAPCGSRGACGDALSARAPAQTRDPATITAPQRVLAFTSDPGKEGLEWPEPRPVYPE